MFIGNLVHLTESFKYVVVNARTIIYTDDVKEHRCPLNSHFGFINSTKVKIQLPARGNLNKKLYNLVKRGLTLSFMKTYNPERTCISDLWVGGRTLEWN